MAKAKPPRKQLYVLRHLVIPPTASRTGAPGTSMFRAFTTWEAAEAERQALEGNRPTPPRALNPFRWLWLHGNRKQGLVMRPVTTLTSFPEPIFVDWLLEGGLTVPEPALVSKPGMLKPLMLRDWTAWWEKHHKKMSERQRARVWQALDKVPFFAITEVPLED